MEGWMDWLMQEGEREGERKKEKSLIVVCLVVHVREREDMPVCPYCAGRQIDDSDEFR